MWAGTRAATPGGEAQGIPHFPGAASVLLFPPKSPLSLSCQGFLAKEGSLRQWHVRAGAAPVAAGLLALCIAGMCGTACRTLTITP